MKKWKSIISALLAGIMILSTAAVAISAVSFTDTAEHWAWTRGYIPYLVEKNVLNGYAQDDGTYTFNPDGTVTRAEFIKMMSETFGLTETIPVSYSDVTSADWFYPYISKAAAQGFLLNYGSSLNPNGALSREEATTLLVRYLDLEDATRAPASTFTDYNTITPAFQDSVLVAVQAGLIEGYKETANTYTFRPQNTLTRAEALTILYRAAGAIYNTSASEMDAGAANTNALITKSDISLSNLDLTGRVIITEGASGGTVTLSGCTIYGTLELRGVSTLVLDKCTIYAMNIDTAASVTVSLKNKTNLSYITMDTTANLNIDTGCAVSNLKVTTGAKNVNVTGTGAISKLDVYASGFVSTIAPQEFMIANGLNATLNGKVYSGTSADLDSFVSLPYLSENNSRYYLNLSPIADGKVYYYYTNLSSVPTAVDFNGNYSSATYSGSFDVRKERVYGEATFETSKVAGYDYVVVQLVAGTRKYAPIRIDNEPTIGTGFTDALYSDGAKIDFTSVASGKILYYYSQNGESISITNFLTNYNSANSSLKGTVNITAGYEETLHLSSGNIQTHPFVILVLQNAKGQYYNPVVISAGSNGFANEPAISTINKIAFTSNVTGTLYYYYTDDKTVVTPSEFANTWRTQVGSDSASITAKQASTVTYDSSYAESYQYMVFCIKDSDGDYRTPFILDIHYNSGFSIAPYIVGSSEISFKSAERGTVYWYFTKSSSAPSAEKFMSEYKNASSGMYGTIDARYTANSYFINFDPSYTSTYPYIAIMLVDKDGTSYQPVMIDVKNDTNTGFDILPFCDPKNELVYFKASAKGTLYFYFSRSSTSYSETPERFMENYIINGGGSLSVGTTLDSFSYSSIDTDIYPGIMLMFTDSSNTDHYPVYVAFEDAEEESGSSSNPGTSATGTGLKVVSVSTDTVKIMSESSGNVYYKETNDPNGNPLSGSYSVLNIAPNTVTSIPVSGSYSYLVLALSNSTTLYNTLSVDLSNRFESDGSITGGNTTVGQGFIGSFKNTNGILSFNGIAINSGVVNINVSIGGTYGSTLTSAVLTAGEVFTVTLDTFNLNDYINNPVIQAFGSITFTAQLTSLDGAMVYDAYTYEFLLP